MQQSITAWIQQLKAGEAEAAQRLWEIYFLRMVEHARQKLVGATKSVADEEDVALSAFRSFCIRAREGHFTRLTDRNNLWPLLMVITQNKSIDLIRQQNRQRRRESDTRGHFAISLQSESQNEVTCFEDLLSREPDPEFAADMADELQYQLRQLDSVGDPDLPKIALLKLEGYSTTEIASSIGCVRRSIERKLQLISAVWTANSDSKKTK